MSLVKDSISKNLFGQKEQTPYHTNYFKNDMGMTKKESV